MIHSFVNPIFHPSVDRALAVLLRFSSAKVARFSNFSSRRIKEDLDAIERAATCVLVSGSVLYTRERKKENSSLPEERINRLIFNYYIHRLDRSKNFDRSISHPSLPNDVII